MTLCHALFSSFYGKKCIKFILCYLQFFKFGISYMYMVNNDDKG